MEPDTLVILIHGFCRDAKDMFFWKKYLHREFPRIITPNLPTRYSSFEKCVDILSSDIAEAHPGNYKNLYFAGHSMGGLMAREYLRRSMPANAAKLVCVGTPHYGSKLADIALLLPGTGLIWQPLNALKTSARKTVTSPEIPGLKIGAIVSKNNAHWPGKLFLSSSADGLVETSSATPPDADAVTFTDAGHVKMQYDENTARLIKQFFLTGNF